MTQIGFSEIIIQKPNNNMKEKKLACYKANQVMDKNIITYHWKGSSSANI